MAGDYVIVAWCILYFETMKERQFMWKETFFGTCRSYCVIVLSWNQYFRQRFKIKFILSSPHCLLEKLAVLKTVNIFFVKI